MSAAGERHRALVLARAPVPGACLPRLESLLGPEGCARLQTLLIRRAATWAATVAPARAYLAVEPAGAAPEVAAVAGHQVEVVAGYENDPKEGLAELVARLPGGAESGPLLAARSDVPALSVAHARAALDDLDTGWDLSVGPTHDGGWYLLALRQPARVLAVGYDAPQDSAGMVGHWLAATTTEGLQLGLLRAERALRTPQDLRALLADPLTPADLREVLTGPGAPMRDPMGET